MRAEAVVIGLDTPAHHGGGFGGLYDALAELGLELGSVTCVSSREIELEEALKLALGRSFLVVISGGRGSDPLLAAAAGLEDIAKKILSRVLERRLILQNDLLQRFEDAYRASNLDTPAGFEKMALLPSGARAIEDPRGLPSGFFMENGGRYILYLPLFPKDLKSAVPEELAKLLIRSRGLRRWGRHRLIRSYGVEEARVRELLKDIGGKDRMVELASTLEGVDVKVSARSDIAEKAEQILEETCAAVVAKMGGYCYGNGPLGIEHEVARLLMEKKLTIAAAESCTGGLVSKRLTDVPGSSAYMERGAVTYSNRAKEEMLNVPAKTLQEHGAVSKEAAQAMAEGVRWGARTDLGLSVTGIAGPGGGTIAKPVGLVYIGLATEKGVTVKGFNFPGDRDAVRFATSQRALDIVRRYLIS